MKKAIKKAWIDALRSGKYKQTRGTLRDETGHCCLGVLTEVVRDEFPEELRDMRYEIVDEQHNGLGYRLEGGIGTRTGSIPLLITLRLALNDRIGTLKSERLAAMNDDDRMSFAEIADWIDANIVEDDDDNNARGTEATT